MRLVFQTPELTDREAIVIPASGRTRRLLQAILMDNSGQEVENIAIVYEMEKSIEGIWIDGDMLYLSDQVAQSTQFHVIAKVKLNQDIWTTLKIEVIKDFTLQDALPSPLEKEGWELVYHEEFQDGQIDWRKWSPYYLRGWTEDRLAKADFYFEDGKFIITSKPDREPWCVQDGGHRVSSIQSFERTHLHRFGTVTGSREIPDFQGFATKYGYFEVRMRLPDTKDGSHFAWWMIGVQDDQHITAEVEGSEQYAFGVFTNQTAEFDIVEQTLDAYTESKDYEPNIWRPVIHPNGSTDLNYLWVEPTPIINSPSHEFHVYGFEWNEKGTKFYLDGKLVQETDRTPNYRMMTLFSLYLGAKDGSCGMGRDRGIYPKEALIDYFRVYKKKEEAKPISLVINDYQGPSYLQIPNEKVKRYRMTAYAMDQRDKPIEADILWYLGTDVQGMRVLSRKEEEAQGVTIHRQTGEVTVEAHAKENQDIFLVAYCEENVKEVKHLKLSKKDPYGETLRFEISEDTITKGSERILHATVYDQYGKRYPGQIRYTIMCDIVGSESCRIEGVQLRDTNRLVVDKDVPSNTYLFIEAQEEKQQLRACLVLRVI